MHHSKLKHVCNSSWNVGLFTRLELGWACEKGFGHMLRHEYQHVFRGLHGGEAFEEEVQVGPGPVLLLMAFSCCGSGQTLPACFYRFGVNLCRHVVAFHTCLSFLQDDSRIIRLICRFPVIREMRKALGRQTTSFWESAARRRRLRPLRPT